MSDNPERVLCSFHIGGPGTVTADKQFSIYVSRTLNFLGYTHAMIKYRVKMYRDGQDQQNAIYKNSHQLVEDIGAGSKAEGLTSIFESDIDCMTAMSDVVCADNVRRFIHKRKTTVFQTNRQYIHPGYTKLKLVNCFGNSCINDALIQEENGDKYLSSYSLVSAMFQMYMYLNDIYLHERSGPSVPISDLEGTLHGDNVCSFRCVCPDILQNFLTRPRPHNRPSRNELRDISVMDAHVVPVGQKGSTESLNEWRICFTKAELYLVQRLNETETKLYIILKMVSKLLKFISKDITSYIMKNIVLWLVELYPVYLFTEDLLTHALIQALRFLHKCVEANYLPSYIIPERNLFAERFNPVKRLQLTTFLSTLIQERGYLLLRSKQLRNGITILYREPDMAEEYRKRRDMAEKLLLLRNNIRHDTMNATGSSTEELDVEETDDKIIKTHINIFGVSVGAGM